MVNLKEEKGAITLYVLVCVMFFIIALVNINVNLNNKLANLDAEYKKIQQSYSTQGIH